tara:strand:+ start:335 stop:646 length:312 start_codon:yes stop_codon:yes gene_type:complete
MDKIKLYGQTYAKNDKALVNTLFNANGTANGTFKRYKNRIELTHTSGEVIAIIRAIDGVAISTKSNGRYMFSTSSISDSLFSIPSGYSSKIKEAEKLLNNYNL